MRISLFLPNFLLLAGIIAYFSFSNPAHGQNAQILGTLSDELKEASGIAISRLNKDILYHVNDSGDGAYFYLSDRKGKVFQKVEIDNFKAWDVEDLSSGPCFENKNCLFIADIGDNPQFREQIEVIVVEEQQNFPAKIKALKHLKIKYPDQAHNAEAFSQHPNGDLYIVTKEETKKLWQPTLQAAKIFRIRKKDWENYSEQKKDFLIPEKVASIDIPQINANETKWAKIVTSFDIRPDGKAFVILNYLNAIEFFYDLSIEHIPDLQKIRAEQKIKVHKITQQNQMEAVCYDHIPDKILYTSEKRDRVMGQLHLFDLK